MTSRSDTSALPGLAADGATPVFAAPWQAHAFAMVVALHEKGLFTWPEWAAALAAEIKAAGDRDTGDTYYAHWLAALERLLAAKRVTTADALARYRDAWDTAAHRTPHGAPIELMAEDFRD